MPPVLPGYHYYSEQGKYFKIVPNQHATATSSYSQAAVAEEEVRQREGKEVEEWQAKFKETTVQRNNLLEIYPLGGFLGLRRELGKHEGHTDGATAAIWAKGLGYYQFIETPEPPKPEPTRNIHDFVRDPATGAIAWTEDWSDYLSHVNVPKVRIPILDHDGTPMPHVERYFMAEGQPIGLMPHSDTSSLSISPDRVVLATGLGGHDHPSLHLVRLIDPFAYMTNLRNHRRWQRQHSYHPETAYVPEIDANASGVVKLGRKVETVWCSAAGPHAHRSVFAVGTSVGAQLVGLRDGSVETWSQEYNWPDDEQSHDTNAVDFLSHTNVLCGMRSGKVRLWDIRSNGSNVRFQHGSCVLHVRAIDENKALVAGLDDMLSLYDLRFIKTLAPSSPSGLQPSDPEGKGKAPTYRDHSTSLPLHSFPTYRMKENVYPRLGFDVYRNLVAVGTEDQKVRIFDLHSGRELQIGNGDSSPNGTLTGQARCLKFVEYGYNGDGLRLLVANGTRIDAWAW